MRRRMISIALAVHAVGGARSSRARAHKKSEAKYRSYNQMCVSEAVAQKRSRRSSEHYGG